jgi:thiol-disulfide isomerase/thioredoxin
VTRHEARDAIEALLVGRLLEVENTPTVGCSTKWAYKEVDAAQEVSQIDQDPVRLEMAGVDQMKQLRRNKTKKFVLVNFWATWCGPCEKEFPELQKTYRMYWQRPFEVVTVSVNAPDEKKAVLKFLNEQHATTRNYLFSVTDRADAIAAFGTEWSGGVPYTVLLGPDGQVLYKNQGEINPLEVRRVILKNLPEDNFIGAHAYWNRSF